MNDAIKIDRLSSEGRGIGFLDRPCFVLGALPAETVNYKILKKHKGIFEAVTTSLVSEASNIRVESVCEHYLMCGACSLQHMAYRTQLDVKLENIKSGWQHKSYPEVIWDKCLTGPQYHYRRKARVSLRYVDKKSQLIIGFKELDSRKVLNMNMCSILTPSITKYLFELRDVLRQTNAYKNIPQIELVEGDSRVAAVVRHLVDFCPESLSKITEFAKHSGWHIWLQRNGLDSIKPVNSEQGYLSYSMPKYNLNLNFGPLDFIQVNAEINLKMIDLVIDWLDLSANDRVLDLFCGLGNFSLPVAKNCGSLVGVEGSEEMVFRASSNASNAGLSSKTSFFKHDLRNDPVGCKWYNNIYDKVILDPPRSGARYCLEWLVKKSPKRIIYISCNPQSFLNDIEVLFLAGYKASKICLADMFPQTSHAEVIACFDKIA